MSGANPGSKDRHRGRLLKKRRQDKKITQQELAVSVGVTTQTIYNLESGIGWGHIDKAAAICARLELDIFALAAIDNPKEQSLNLNSEIVLNSKNTNNERLLLDAIRDLLDTSQGSKAESIPQQNIDLQHSEG